MFEDFFNRQQDFGFYIRFYVIGRLWPFHQGVVIQRDLHEHRKSIMGSIINRGLVNRREIPYDLRIWEEMDLEDQHERSDAERVIVQVANRAQLIILLDTLWLRYWKGGIDVHHYWKAGSVNIDMISWDFQGIFSRSALGNEEVKQFHTWIMRLMAFTYADVFGVSITRSMHGLTNRSNGRGLQLTSVYTFVFWEKFENSTTWLRIIYISPQFAELRWGTRMHLEVDGW